MTDREMQTEAALLKMDDDEWLAVMSWATPALIRDSQQFLIHQICRRAEQIKARLDEVSKQAGNNCRSEITENIRDLFERLGIKLEMA